MAKRSLPQLVEEEYGKLPHFLLYALLEWSLIFLLFLDGFLAFLANEFAKFFHLRIPCILCTRIDHILLGKTGDYYNDSICESHKREISSLAYCHVHKKVSDIRKMCEACLLSFATEKEANCDTYKSVIGILHKDVECFVEDDQDISLSWPMKTYADGSGGGGGILSIGEKSFCNKCSCCGVPMKVKSMHVRCKNANPAPASSPRALRNLDSPRASVNSPRGSRNLDSPRTPNSPRAQRNLQITNMRYSDLKLSNNDAEIGDSTKNKEDGKPATVPVVTDTEYMNEDRTPFYGKGNKFFGIPLSDPTYDSPMFGSRLGRKYPLEKTDSEAADTESLFNHLRRQVKLDRKSLMALYMELDEERNASAVAADEAMAMITRLQTEKASVQMEALQYQRMMEEQAEYDQEVLHEVEELLARREEEIRYLEAELDAFHDKYGFLEEFEWRHYDDGYEQDDRWTAGRGETRHLFRGIGDGNITPRNLIREFQELKKVEREVLPGDGETKGNQSIEIGGGEEKPEILSKEAKEENLHRLQKESRISQDAGETLGKLSKNTGEEKTTPENSLTKFAGEKPQHQGELEKLEKEESTSSNDGEIQGNQSKDIEEGRKTLEKASKELQGEEPQHRDGLKEPENFQSSSDDVKTQGSQTQEVGGQTKTSEKFSSQSEGEDPQQHDGLKKPEKDVHSSLHGGGKQENLFTETEEGKKTQENSSKECEGKKLHQDDKPKKPQEEVQTSSDDGKTQETSSKETEEENKAPENSSKESEGQKTQRLDGSKKPEREFQNSSDDGKAQGNPSKESGEDKKSPGNSSKEGEGEKPWRKDESEKPEKEVQTSSNDGSKSAESSSDSANQPRNESGFFSKFFK